MCNVLMVKNNSQLIIGQRYPKFNIQEHMKKNRLGYTHRDNRTRELAMSRDRGPLCKVKMVA